MVFLCNAEITSLRGRIIWRRMLKDTPFNIVGYTSALEFPNVFREFSGRFLAFIDEVMLMISQAFLECGACESDVLLWCTGSWVNCCLVDNVLH